MPSTAPSSPAGPAGRPRPVRTLVAMDQRNTPATTRYETPSSAPSAPPGPAGRPQPVVLSVYSDQKTCVCGRGGGPTRVVIKAFEPECMRARCEYRDEGVRVRSFSYVRVHRMS